MGKLKGTETLKNLMKAFAGESQARNRYTYYAGAAKKDGYKQIEALFIETADNEKEHAKRFYKHILANMDDAQPFAVQIEADYPVSLGSTLENLKAAAAGENEEHTKLYPQFAEIAEKEGFDDIAHQFRKIAEVEVEHEKRYLKLAQSVESGKFFKKDGETEWKCRNCGYHHKGAEAPEKCPACLHPQAHFELFCVNY